MKAEDFFGEDWGDEEQILSSWMKFHREITFGKDIEEDEHHYVNLHKKPENWNF